MARRALIVGIDRYKHADDLNAAAADARAMEELLMAHADGTPNYDCLLWPDETDRGEQVTSAALRLALDNLFKENGDVLFYFAGHGTTSSDDNWLVTAEGGPGAWGISMDEVLKKALRSGANEILILLDCCRSGAFANPALLNLNTESAINNSVLRDNMTVIAATPPKEVTVEVDGHGVFTSALLSALKGGAADDMGAVSVSAVYSYIENRLQRPA